MTAKIEGKAEEEQPVLEMKKSSPFLQSLKPMLLGKEQNKIKQNKRRGEQQREIYLFSRCSITKPPLEDQQL